jgi:hypothetical protein
MSGLLVFLGGMVSVAFLLMGVAYLRRDTHCMECGGRLDVPVWHCSHSMKDSPPDQSDEPK